MSRTSSTSSSGSVPVVVAFTTPSCVHCHNLRANSLPYIDKKYKIYEFSMDGTVLPEFFDFHLHSFPTLIMISSQEFARFYDPQLKVKKSHPKRPIKFTGINVIPSSKETHSSKHNLVYLIPTGYPHSAENINDALRNYSE